MKSKAEKVTNGVAASDVSSTANPCSQEGEASNADAAAVAQDNSDVVPLNPRPTGEDSVIPSKLAADESNSKDESMNAAEIDGATKTESTEDCRAKDDNQQAPPEVNVDPHSTQVEQSGAIEVACTEAENSSSNEVLTKELNETSASKELISPPHEPAAGIITDAVHGNLNQEAGIQVTEGVASVSDKPKLTATQGNLQGEITAVETVYSTPAAPKSRKSYLSSLTAQFAPETKAAWAEVFGVRYEPNESLPDAAQLARKSPVSPSKLEGSSQFYTTPLALQSREPLRLRRHSYRERIRGLAASASDEKLQHGNCLGSPSRSTKSRLSNQFECNGTPLELTGLSLTQIRFCHERAIDNTCRNFDRIRSNLLNENQPNDSRKSKDVEIGVFVTQWELEQALRDAQIVGDDSGVASDSSYADIPIDTILEATWFLPFDQLPRLRTLVLQITRRHLNESKLARLNRHLRHQLLWIPHSTKLQQLMVRLTDDAPDVLIETTQPISLVKDSPALIRELAECIEASPQHESPSDAIFARFRTAAPVLLARNWRLGSVLKLQRLVYFRFLLLAIAHERRKLASGSERITDHRLKRDTLVSAARRRTVMEALQPQQSNAKSKPRRGKRQRRRQVNSDDSSDQESESQSDSSKQERSLVKQEDGSEHKKVATHISEKPTSDEVSAVQILQKRLDEAIYTLEKIFPTVTGTTSKGETQFVAVKATYIAATTFKQRIHLMVEDRPTIEAQLQQFVDALETAIREISNIRVVSPKPTARTKADAPLPHRTPILRRPSSRFPPPYPESEKSHPDEDDDTSSKRTYPPPYTNTTPAFWTFQPEIEPPKASIAKQRRTLPHASLAQDSPTVVIPPTASTKSPGVGSYDIRRSDHLTFREGPSFSFAPSSCDQTPAPTSKPLSSSKPRVWKSSLAFQPPLPNVEEARSELADTDISSSYLHENPEELEWPEEPERIEAEAQCDETNNSPPPADYVEGTVDGGITVGVDLNEALRLQQRMFVDDFLQTVSARQHEVARNPRSTTSRHALRRGKPAVIPSSHGQVYWRGSLDPSDRGPDTSRFVTRLRKSRETASPSNNTKIEEGSSVPPPFYSKQETRRTQSSSGKERPRSATKKKAPSTHNQPQPVELPSPDGRVEPDVQHQTWAARVGAFYASRMDQQAL